MSRGDRVERGPVTMQQAPGVTRVFFWLALASLPVWVIDWAVRAVEVGGSLYWLPCALCVIGAVWTLFSRRAAVRYRLLGAVILLVCGPVLTFGAFALTWFLGTLFLGP